MKQPDGIEILLEDGPCFVLLKPGGLLTQAPPHIDSLERRMKHFIKVRDEKPGKVYLGVPHRLDRPVSGALVVARNVRATRRIAEQFEDRTVRKTYLAVVEGTVQPDEGTWTDHLWKVTGEARAEVVAPDHPEARRAVLHYRVLARFTPPPESAKPPERDPPSADSADPLPAGVQPIPLASVPHTWLEIQLETGRTHQIRVQAGSRGFPILGDELYGAQSPFGPTVEDPRDRWIALHAHQLGFRHPKSRERVEVRAPLPRVWQDRRGMLP